MKLVSRVLEVVFTVGVLPLLLVCCYALLDAFLVTRSAEVNLGLIALAEEGNSDLFEQLRTKSKDIVAWLKIDNTNINHPVVQGRDNAWFLNRDIEGKFATAGSIFLDYRNSKKFNDTFSIIYGHRMSGVEMFSDIQKFADEEFFKAHDTGVLRLEDKDKELSIVAYAEIEADDWSIYDVENSRDGLIGVKKIFQSAKNINGELNQAAKYIMLSTCDGEAKNLRNVLLVEY